MHEEHHSGRNPTAEMPRVEPEIISPERSNARFGARERVWVFVDRGGRTRRVSVSAPGPFAIILALLIAGFVAAAVLLLLLGMIVVWIPIVVAVIAAFVLSARIRGFWRRLRNR
jgi:hypothetical protein